MSSTWNCTTFRRWVLAVNPCSGIWPQRNNLRKLILKHVFWRLVRNKWQKYLLFSVAYWECTAVWHERSAAWGRTQYVGRNTALHTAPKCEILVQWNLTYQNYILSWFIVEGLLWLSRPEGSGFRKSVGAKQFFPIPDQTDRGAYSAFCAKGTGSLPEEDAARVWRWPPARMAPPWLSMSGAACLLPCCASCGTYGVPLMGWYLSYY